MSNEISLVMGSSSDWSTMKEAANILDEFGVKYDKAVISAHRMPQEMFEFAQGAVSAGVKVMIAANTVLPVIGVPVQSHALSGMDSLLSIVQMPAGVPVATTAIGVSGAKNAALLALEILGTTNPRIQLKMTEYRKQMHDKAAESGDQLV